MAALAPFPVPISNAKTRAEIEMETAEKLVSGEIADNIKESVTSKVTEPFLKIWENIKSVAGVLVIVAIAVGGIILIAKLNEGGN